MHEDKEISLWFYDFVLDQGQILFSAGNLNGVFQADLRTGKSRLLGIFSDESLFVSNLYCGTYLYKERILFVPMCGKEFAVYDMEKGKIIKLHTEFAVGNRPLKNPIAHFYGSLMIGKNVYAFGWDIPEIVCVDMETLHIKKYSELSEEIRSIGNKIDNGPYFFRDVCTNGNSLYVTLGMENAILELNMETDRIMIHSIGRKECIYKTLAFDGKYFWLTDQMKRIARVESKSWDFQDKEIGISLFSEYFNSSIFMNEEVWLLTNKEDNICKIECGKFSVCEKKLAYADRDKWFPNIEKYGAAMVKKIGANQLAIFAMRDCMMHILTNEDDIYRVRFYADTASEKYYTDCWYKEGNKKIIFERSGYQGFGQLGNFLRYVESSIPDQWETEKPSCGDMIYKYIG